jgi:glycosyltransferase involved in cell wall biosynthesis
MIPQLSICIPTYNRANYLEECLTSLALQVKFRSDVEIIISDNNSTDATSIIVDKFKQEISNIKYFRNQENLGFDGNTVKCFERATGGYIALLSDEDRYCENEIDSIIQLIQNGKYCLILLNYYGFSKLCRKLPTIYAPESDVIFHRPYDILNYPSVGHFSGFIYNSELAKKILYEILNRNPLDTRDRSRGIYLEVAARTAVSSGLPSYYIGKRGLAARLTLDKNYNGLESDCLHYYRLFYTLNKEGLINIKDLEYRKDLVLSWLPRKIMSGSPKIPDEKFRSVVDELKLYLSSNWKFRVFHLPLLYAGRIDLIKYMYLCLSSVSRFSKKLRLGI